MSVGDLVFCHGYRGIILKTHHSVYYTEHYIYWFGINDVTPFGWVNQKQLLRIA